MTTTFAQLVDEVSAAYLEFTGDTTVLFQRGKKKLAEHQQKRRIVFVRPGGEVQDSTRAGSVDIGDGRRARMIKRRAERVQVSIFAEDEDIGEAMLDAVIASCELALGSGFQPGEYLWLTEDEQAAYLNYTEVIRLTAAWHKPVTDLYEGLTQIEGQTHVCSLGAGDFSVADFFAGDFLTAGGEAAA